MEILANIWTVTYGVLLVILGLNALIVVHEFGHFIVARLCGVRCEKFYIWFDWPRGLKFFKFKWGDTEYGLGLFPLGGYVKMLGQEDDPGAIRAEIERAKLQPAETGGQDTGGLTPPALDNAPPAHEGSRASIFAPDSYLSKSVPQRLAIIVAGVIMNFLFAIVCAAGAYMIGVKESTPSVGTVISGSPAWIAGMQTGDRITAIDDKPARAFGDVRMKMIEGKETIQLTIDRQGEPHTVTLSPRRQQSDLMPKIGIAPMSTLELFSGSIVPMWKKYYSEESLDEFKKMGEYMKKNPLDTFEILGVDVVDEGGMKGRIVRSYTEYQEILLEAIGLPITCTFGTHEQTGCMIFPVNLTHVEIPAIPMQTIPVRFKMGTITAVLPDSDAKAQGIAPGDTLVSVDGDAEFDPLKLPQILLRKVNAQQESVELVVKKASGDEEPLTVKLKPIRALPELGSESVRDPLASTALGLAWKVEPIIAAVDESALTPEQPMPAVGDRVVSVEFVNCATLLNRTSFSETTNEGGFFIRNINEKIDIPYIFVYLLQDAHLSQKRTGFGQKMLGKLRLSEPVKEDDDRVLSVRLVLEGADEKMKIVNLPMVEATDWFNTDRGFGLKPELTTFKATGLGEALNLGTVQMVKYSVLVFQSVDALVNGRVSAKALNGPVGIVMIIYQVAQGGWSVYLMLLCLIGANLAVINILPIPPLDGGHVLFLTYEGIFRRPPNELVQVILSYLGLFLILLLMIWTVALDFSWIPRW
jgi:regulator of sigma E protease